MQKSENITVAIRLRPPKKEDGDSFLQLNPEQHTIEIAERKDKDKQKFLFDHVFDSTTSQEKLFNTVVKNSIDTLFQGYNVTIFAYGNTGCLDPDTPVLMFNGKTKKAKDIIIGDLVMGDDSTPRKVLELFTGEDDMYDVIQSHGKKYRVNKSHVLSLYCPNPSLMLENNVYKIKWYDKHGKQIKIFKVFSDAVDFFKYLPKNNIIDISVEDYIQKSKTWKKLYKGVHVDVEYKEGPVISDPYTFGLLIDDRIDNIPDEFLFNCKKIRLEFLAGILDSENFDFESCRISYKNKKLLDDITTLIQSLGFIARRKPFSVKIEGFLSDIPVKKVMLKNIFSVCNIRLEYCGKGRYNGFMLDGNHRFLLDDFTVTHNSGKSYTMFGKEDSNVEQGIIPRACETLFQVIKEKADDIMETNIKCSFLEIYREQIKDLLDRSEKTLRLRYDTNKGVYVQGLADKIVYNKQEVLNTIKDGVNQRTIASTALNSVSSRSHAVFTLTMMQKLTDGSEIVSKLHLIDLAGSENVGRSEVQGVGLAEAQTINKSLSCLGNVIYALTEKGRDHIPYRDSKLTYLLQDSLGGNAKTILIATISPCYTDTINTLKFAKRAKEIKNIPKVNKNESIANLLATIEILNKKIAELEEKCEDSQVIIQAVETADNETKELAFLKTKCQRLERKVVYMEQESKKNVERNQETRKLFRKQRELAKRVSKELYRERMKNYNMNSELDQLRFFYESIQGAVSTPELLPIIINRFKIAEMRIEIPEDVESDVEVESP